MTHITFKTINFNKDEVQSKEIDVGASLEIKSAKSVAYVVRWQLAKRRLGSASIKAMSEISGTTSKPWKQKGTGRARQGSLRSVQFVGGSTCHGPVLRSFNFSIPKKIIKIALSDALKLKLAEDKIILFSDFNSEIKTSKVNLAFAKNNIKKALVLCDGDEAFVKSARNLKDVKILDIKAINVYDILNFDYLVIDAKVFESKILGELI